MNSVHSALRLVALMSFACIVCAQQLWAQWIPGTVKQSRPLAGQGVLFVHEGRMYLWNEEKHFQMSDDNGQSWIESPESIGGVSPHVQRMTASGAHVYAALNFGTGNGVVLHSSDKGMHWEADTTGAPGHALGWSGMPAVNEVKAFGKWLYVAWDGPNYFDIQELGGPFVRQSYMAGANQPRTVVASGDTLFCSANTFYYTADGGKNYITAKGQNYPGAGTLVRDGHRFYLFAIRTWLKPAVLSYSDDLGDTWTDIDISAVSSRRIVNGDLYFPVAAFIKGQRIECSFTYEGFGKSPNTWKSTDLGKTWSVDTLGLTPAYVPIVSCFAYTPDGYLWCSPSYENIYKQKIDAGSGSTSVEESPSGSLSSSDPLIELRPQPATTDLHCRWNTVGAQSLQLYSLCGELLMDKACTANNPENHISVENINDGIYVLKLTFRDQRPLTRMVHVYHH